MNINVKRIARKADYTIGKLYIDGKYFCDTLEDTDRGLSQEMPFDYLKHAKVYGVTAIPTGEYELKWTYSPKYRRYMPQIMNVPAYEGIRIHSGNTDKDTLGCILLGENKVVGKVINSRVTCDRFYNIVEQACRAEKVTINIE